MADLTYFPRLADLKKLGGSEEPASAAQITLETRRSGPRITPKQTFAERTGYQSDFLGDFVIPWPSPIGSRKRDILLIAGSDDSRLDYTHFSITMSAVRRMAILVGVNIDGRSSQSIPRTNDKWSLDGRIGIEQQIGEDLYSENLLDRGHLVRREDPNWGDDAITANEDTFHFTNCAPQMAGFNQKTWLSLEKYVLDNTRRWKERVTVFSGPIFRDDDRLYRGVLIPTAFWKVIAFVSDDGKPSATAYMIDQRRELGSLEAAFGVFKTYQRSVRQIELLTDIDFGELSQFDGFSNEELTTGTRIESEIRSPADIRV